MRAILWITKRGRTRNEDVRAILEVKETMDDILNARPLRWFGHVVRSPEPSIINASFKEICSGQKTKRTTT